MNIGIFLSNKGGSPLQAGMERGLAQLGHRVSYFNNCQSYDVVLIFNQCAHTTDYVYPEFPRINQPIAFIDTAEYGYFKRLPGIVNHYWNAFAPGSLNHDTKNKDQQLRLMRFLEGRSFPYFLREFSKYVDFPKAYHPIDYPLYHFSVCPHLPNKDEYLKRSLDLFVRWGGSHPWRINITEALRACHTKCEIDILQDNVVHRMPQKQFFERTRSAKCSVSFDGYGSGSFRMTEVLVRCLLLQGPLSIRTRQPLLDGVHCVEYAVLNDGETFISTDVCNKLRDSLDDPERSYCIYEAGYHHCMAHYTETATAQYVIDTIVSHNWSNQTTLI